MRSTRPRTLQGGSVLQVCLLVALLAPAAAASDTGALRGRVADRDDTPVAGAVVHAVRQVDDEGCPSDEPPCPEPVRAEARDDGTWQIGGLAPGEYRVHAAAPTGRLADAWWDGRAQVEAGETTPDVDLTLPPAASVHGLVADHEGEPLAEVEVTVRRTSFSRSETTTARDGRFTLDGLAGGRHEVEIVPPQAGLEAVTRAVDVDEAGEEDVGRVGLDLRPVARTRVAGTTRVETAVEASRLGFEEADRVVLAAAGDFPDALAAAPLAAGVEGPLLLVGSRLHAGVLDELRRLGTSEAVLVGGVAAIPLVVELELERAGVDVRRLAGEVRYDTAALIAGEVGAPAAAAVVVSGTGFADALSAAPLAAAQGMPILLTPAGGLAPDAAAALDRLGVQRTLVVGGPAVVGGAVEAALPAPRRIAGQERYATSAALAEYGSGEGVFDLATVAVATGRAFPDALSAGPVAATRRSPVLLVDGASADGAEASRSFLRRHVADVGAVWVFGGAAAVSEQVAERVVEEAGP